MFGAVVQVVDRLKAVRAAAEKASVNNLNHAAASLRKAAQASIQKAPPATRVSRKKGVRRARHAASAPGSPPYTGRGALKNAIVFDQARPGNLRAIVGPRGSRVGTSASAHEFGGEYKGGHYPQRPFMRPALEQTIDKFAGSFQASIGE